MIRRVGCVRFLVRSDQPGQFLYSHGGRPKLKPPLTVKLVWPLATVSLILLTVGVVGAWHVQQLHRRASKILTLNVASIRAAEELEIATRETRSQLNQYLLTGSRDYLDRVPAVREEADLWLAEAARLATTAQEQIWIAKITAGHQEFDREFQQVSRHTSDESQRQAVMRIIHDVLEVQILDPARDYLDFNEQQLAESSEENDRLASRLVAGLLLLGTCGAVAGVTAGYAMARALRRSIVELNVPIRDVQGKLNEVVGPFPVPTNAGIDGLDAVLRKISERVAMVVEQLQQTQRDVLRSEQLAAVGQLAAGLAHELRNPLMAMKLLVQTASEQGDAEAILTGRDLAIIEEEIERLEHLVQMFLDFARPPKLRVDTFDVRQSVRRAVHLLDQRAAHRGVVLSVRVPQDPVVVEADEMQVRQVLLNLILNAMDAVPNGGAIAVELGAAADSDETHWAVLRVLDNGCGLPAELGNRIFDPFISTKETGIGLGLSICRRIVESHGGSISAASRAGGGSVFTVRLPTVTLERLRTSRPAPVVAATAG